MFSFYLSLLDSQRLLKQPGITEKACEKRLRWASRCLFAHFLRDCVEVTSSLAAPCICSSRREQDGRRGHLSMLTNPALSRLLYILGLSELLEKVRD